MCSRRTPKMHAALDQRTNVVAEARTGIKGDAHVNLRMQIDERLTPLEQRLAEKLFVRNARGHCTTLVTATGDCTVEQLERLMGLAPASAPLLSEASQRRAKSTPAPRKQGASSGKAAGASATRGPHHPAKIVSGKAHAANTVVAGHGGAVGANATSYRRKRKASPPRTAPTPVDLTSPLNAVRQRRDQPTDPAAPTGMQPTAQT